MRKSFIHIKSVRKRGEPGTKKLTRIYGNDLVCVRYKYDYKNRKKYKTIELKIEEGPWEPDDDDKYLTQKVEIRVDYKEIGLRKKLKSEGAVWDPGKRVWRTTFKTVLELGLEERIIM